MFAILIDLHFPELFKGKFWNLPACLLYMCRLYTFFKSKNVFTRDLFLKIMALCIVSIQEWFLIKSRLWRQALFNCQTAHAHSFNSIFNLSSLNNYHIKLPNWITVTILFILQWTSFQRQLFLIICFTSQFILSEASDCKLRSYIRNDSKDKGIRFYK